MKISQLTSADMEKINDLFLNKKIKTICRQQDENLVFVFEDKIRFEVCPFADSLSVFIVE